MDNKVRLRSEHEISCPDLQTFLEEPRSAGENKN